MSDEIERISPLQERHCVDVNYNIAEWIKEVDRLRAQLKVAREALVDFPYGCKCSICNEHFQLAKSALSQMEGK